MKTEILGINIDKLTFAEALDKTLGFLDDGKQHMIFTPNPEMIMAARKDREFFDILNSADMLIPDGIGVVLASKLNKVKIRQRVTGIDFCLALFESLKDTDKTIYLFGSKQGVAQRAKHEMELKYSGLKISGVSYGYFDDETEKLIIKDMIEKKPSVIMVGLGLGKQEKWIYNNINKLGASVMIGGGGFLDHFSGDIKRTPVFFRKLGMEWLYRMFALKRFKRQTAIPKFVFAILKEKILSGLSRSR